MPEDISLLPKEIEQRKEREARNRFLRRASLIFLGIAFLVGLAVLVSFLFLDQRLSGLNDEIAKEESKVRSLAVISATASDLDARTKALKSIWQDTSHFSFLLSEILDAVPADVKVTEMNATPVEVAVSGTSKSYASLAQFLRTLKGAEGKESPFEAVELEAVSLDQRTGEAKFDLNLKLREGVLRR